MVRKKPEANELSKALAWLTEAHGNTHRALGISVGNDSKFMVKFFENATVSKQLVIKGIHAFNRSTQVVEEILAQADLGAAE